MKATSQGHKMVYALLENLLHVPEYDHLRDKKGCVLYRFCVIFVILTELYYVKFVILIGS